ncbi:MAG: Eco57I restriction-modification methylase domain-containing protein [Caulobacteraceae bacterium]
MASRRVAAIGALTVEGSLIAPAELALILAQEAANQSETDYGVPRGLTLREEINRYFRIGQAHFSDFAAAEADSHPAAVRLAEALLKAVFGFGEVRRIDRRELGERTFPVTLEALDGRVPVVVVPAGDSLDRPSASLAGSGRTPSAAVALQDWLNANDGALWGLACNGEKLRLARDNPSLTRPAYIEADLRAMFESEALADFTALWLLVHASRFGRPGAAPSECPLERWREAGQKTGLAARERLRGGVEAALVALGTGFLAHPENVALRGGLEDRTLELAAYHGLLLRLVYRLIFLFVAEDRGLLHAPGVPPNARSLYAEGYSVSRLRDRAARRSAWDAHDDLWDGLIVVFEALGGRGAPPLGLPALGGLFALGELGPLERVRLPNRALMEAIWNLAWLRDDGALVPVNWRDLETEELGSVYESLLELTPRLSDDGRIYLFAEGLEAQGHERKTTGSYYTPDSLVQLLLESALDPVLDRAEAEADDPVKGLLTVTVIDPACGSGHFLLAAARRIAARIASARTGGVASRDDRQHALREVVRSCIHGVDRNPMAVELTKVALWIETVEPGKPLGFLDANIRCGDSLLGVFDLAALDKGVPDAAYKPLTGDDREAASVARKDNREQRDHRKEADLFARESAEALARRARAIQAMPEDDLAQLDRKSRAYAALQAEAGWSARKRACDLYVAAFLRPKRPLDGALARSNAPDLVPTTLDVRTALAGSQPNPRLTALAVDLAEEARAFHWPLEFPTIFAAGGFDVVLGNPPWERIKLQEQEFFAAREPEIATAPNAAARRQMIAALGDAEPGSRERALHEAFEQAKRTAEAASIFARVPNDDGGRFPLCGRGDINTYALFAELFSQLAGPRGRAGVIVPTGVATDATTAPFFSALVEGRRLASLIDFENSAPIFQAVHRSFKFSLLTIGRDVGEAEFAFFLTDPAQLAEPERRFALSPAEIARINPNTRTAPVFRARRDAELTAKIYDRVPVLIDEAKGAAGNPWGVSFARMFDMANDSGLFRTAAQLAAAGLVRDGTDWVGATSERWVPLYEAKMIHQFDHRWASADADGEEARQMDRSEEFEPSPRYWLEISDLISELQRENIARSWLLVSRMIAPATNERTLIAATVPKKAIGNSLAVWITIEEAELQVALLGNLNAIVTDFVSRQKVGGSNLNFFYVKQFPILPPGSYAPADLDFIVPRVLELTYTSEALRPFARDLGYDGPPFAWDEDRRAWLRAQLDAWYARAYGLTRDELRYILDPADVMGPDYPSETFRVLKKNEIKRFGEYRTRRLVLEAWDRLSAGDRPGFAAS